MEIVVQRTGGYSAFDRSATVEGKYRGMERASEGVDHTQLGPSLPTGCLLKSLHPVAAGRSPDGTSGLEVALDSTPADLSLVAAIRLGTPDSSGVC